MFSEQWSNRQAILTEFLVIFQEEEEEKSYSTLYVV